jgi:NADH:ubiquinone oxidoreductase subunit 6 (subunit J)
MPGQLAFFVLAGTAILSSVLMISRTKAISSAVWFAIMSLATAGIFLQLRSPLLCAAQSIAIAGVILGTILFAVELGKLDVAIAPEYCWMPKAAAVIVAFSLVAQIGLAILQRHLLPGEKLTALLPRHSLPYPLSLRELINFFVGNNLLPLGLIVCLGLIGITGVGALYRKQKRF